MRPVGKQTTWWQNPHQWRDDSEHRNGEIMEKEQLWAPVPFRQRANQTTVGNVVKEWNVNIINLSYVKMIQPTKLGGSKVRGNGKK